MLLNYKPDDGWPGDFIPFYWEGEYHLFYLKDYRDPASHGEGMPWYHLATRDFVHFTDHGECLPRGTAEEQDLYVFTGSAFYGEGRYHIFYTGHNPHFRKAGRPEQAVMHAVSDDLLHWEKLPDHTFCASPDLYEPHDWRDPFVFWNAEAGEYWMLLAARLKDGPPRRRGCTALCASKDLVHWEVREPFYAPGLYYTHECPDLFQMGGWWYLIFSEFTDANLTRYRMARSLAGPWLAPDADSFDGRAFYAAKTAGDGKQRYLFGWNPTRTGESDSGGWQWGGNLAVHEVWQRPEGTLAVRLPESVRAAFAAPQPLQVEQVYNAEAADPAEIELHAQQRFSCAMLGPLPQKAYLETTATFHDPTRAFGLMLKTSPDLETGYYIRVEPQRARLVFDAWPRPGDQPHFAGLERPLHLQPGKAVRLQVYVDGSICEVYVDGQAALSARMYDHAEGAWGVFAAEGEARFAGTLLRTSSPEA